MTKNHKIIILAFFFSVLYVLVIDMLTNTMYPRWDSIHYVNMAQSGIMNNEHLVAPYAYRPAAPLLAGFLSEHFSISLKTTFQRMTQTSAVLTLFLVFLFARSSGATPKQSLVIMTIVAASFFHVKYPLFHFTMVDVFAYPLIILATWALLARKDFLCLSVSCIGLFFKEFLAIPPFLLLSRQLLEYARHRNGKRLVEAGVTGMLLISVIVLPRFFIKVQHSEQTIDPFHAPHSLALLYLFPMDIKRVANVGFSMMSYWLPSLLLLSVDRARRIWRDLGGMRLILTGYVGLILLLAMYGGTQICIFVTYSLPVQIFLLAALLRQEVRLEELVFLIMATLVYNRIFLHIPQPGALFSAQFYRFTDFYGGWDNWISIETAIRTTEMGIYLSIAAYLRNRKKLFNNRYVVMT